jgi:hypothetical protein
VPEFTQAQKNCYQAVMKFVTDRPFADPEAAARKLLELANIFEPIQDGRIYIEKINGPFLFELKGTPAEYKAGLDRAIAKGLAGAARERNLCPAHRGRCRAVCVINHHVGDLSPVARAGAGSAV